MQTLRTPEDRFAELPDFGYAPHYAEVSDGEAGLLRMAWVEDGPADGSVVLCLHGEPSWSYLYRKMMPVFMAAGLPGPGWIRPLRQARYGRGPQLRAARGMAA